jgi:hypothetical protein
MLYSDVDVEVEAVRASAGTTSIPSFSFISRRFHQFLFFCEPGVTGLVRVGASRAEAGMTKTWAASKKRVEDGPQ